MAKLSADDSEAMYVRFLSGASVPTVDSMYWRALVLWHYEKGIWTPGERGSIARPAPAMPAPDPAQVWQEIIVRATNQRWLFALDVPLARPENDAESRTWAEFGDSGTIRLSGAAKLDHLARYRVVSSPIRPLEHHLSDDAFTAGIALPHTPGDQLDPRVIALADELHQGIAADDTTRYVLAVLRFFRHNHFVYSADPGASSSSDPEAWLSDFLFTRRTGYCEHFASAFAVLMRQEGVPARVVAGYLGGDYNPYTNSYTVAQSNAHAWDEVWIATKEDPREGRWVRYDPTAILSAVEENLAGGGPASPGDSGGLRWRCAPPASPRPTCPRGRRRASRKCGCGASRSSRTGTRWCSPTTPAHNSGSPWRSASASRPRSSCCSSASARRAWPCSSCAAG